MMSMPTLTDRAHEHRVTREDFERFRDQHAARDQLTESNVSVPPELVIEVLSPATWRRDLGAKRDAYAAAGVRHYWVIAPDTPSVTVYRLAGSGGYTEEAHLTGDQTWDVTSPVEVSVCPADLVR